MLKRIIWSLNYKPLTMVGVILCIRDIIFGLGFIFSWTGVMTTALYGSVFALTPTIGPLIAFGVIMTLIAAGQMWALIAFKKRLINILGNIQGFIWLYVSFTALTLGFPDMAIIFLLSFCFPIVYVAYSVRYRERWRRDLGNGLYSSGHPPDNGHGLAPR